MLPPASNSNRKFLESCLAKKRFNQRLLEAAGVDPSRVSLLVSFPRSANGWVRFVIALHRLVYIAEILKPEDLTRVSSRSMQDETGLATPGIMLEGRLIAIQDLLVPDIYLYDRVLVKTKTSSHPDPSPPCLFKTHHLLEASAPFGKSALLLRDPSVTIYSAARLLFREILEDQGADKHALFVLLKKIYNNYLDGYEALLDAGRASSVNIDRLPESLSAWLVEADPEIRFSTAEVRDQLKFVVGRKPRHLRTEEKIRGSRPPFLPDMSDLLKRQERLLAGSPA